MLLRLRISLPDRPGSLARVSRVLGSLGADIRAMAVLEHGANRVIDEFTVAWPGYPGEARLVAALEVLPGVRLHGAWAGRAQPDAFPDLDVLLQVAGRPEDGLRTLTDALPALFGADWAMASGVGPERRVLAASPDAPQLEVLPEIGPSRPMVFSLAPDLHLAAAPAGPEVTMYLGRSRGGPAFHRTEVAHLTRVLEVAAAVTEAGLDPLRRAQWVP